MPKRRVSYEFRPSKRDVESIAWDMNMEPADLTDQDISDWLTRELCAVLQQIREERTNRG